MSRLKKNVRRAIIGGLSGALVGILLASLNSVIGMSWIAMLVVITICGYLGAQSKNVPLGILGGTAAGVLYTAFATATGTTKLGSQVLVIVCIAFGTQFGLMTNDS